MSFNGPLKETQPTGETIADGEAALSDLKERFNVTADRVFDSTIQHSEWISVMSSTTDWERRNELEFAFNSSVDYWIDLSSVELAVKFRIKKRTGANFAEDETHSIPSFARDNMFHNLWRRVDILVNDKVLKNNYDYARGSMISRLLFSKEDEIENLKAFEGFNFSDANPNMTPRTTAGEAVDAVDHADYAPYLRRYTYLRGSKEHTMVGKLSHYFLDQSKMLPFGIPFKIRLVRNTADFLFQTAENAQAPVLEFTEIKFMYKRMKLEPQINSALTEKMAKEEGVYFPISRNVCTVHTIPTNQQSMSINTFITGDVPLRLVIGFVRNEATGEGHKSFDPFFFEPMNVTQMYLTYDSVRFPDNEGHIFDRSENDDMQKSANIVQYKRMMEVIWGSNLHKAALTYDKWRMYHHLYVFDMSPGKDTYLNGGYQQVTMGGDVTLNLTLKTAAAHSYSAVVFAQHQNTLKIAFPDVVPVVEW